ncbi:MAG TPA: ComEC/Rec2 family competence protein, partial [bacterium]|nr:ComEC/Rec2 family competence protein [bacterium]
HSDVILLSILILAFIYIRDHNTPVSLTNSIEPPGWIQSLKNDLAKSCSSLKNREFIMALANGERKFSPEFRNDLINTGTMHLVAISAFHAGIMVILFNFIFKFIMFFLPFRYRTSSAILFILKVIASFFYFFITGGSIPTLRALSFILFFDMFLLKGYFPQPLFLFIISITTVAVIIPHSITSLSFIMSAICVATVLQIYKVLPPSVTLKLICVSAVLNYALLPVYSMISGNFPLMAPLVNLFVIPVVSISIPFITLAQFTIPFSVDISAFFLHLSDIIIEPAQFMISFLGRAASDSLVPLIDPPFVIKIIFVTTFFLSIYLRKKAKTAALIANFILIPFFALNFQSSPFTILRSDQLFEKAYCITYPGNTGRIFFDRYRYNPKFNSFLLNRIDSAAAICGISSVISIQTREKLSAETEKMIRKRKRFSNVKFFHLTPETPFPECQRCLQAFRYYDPFP